MRKRRQQVIQYQLLLGHHPSMLRIGDLCLLVFGDEFLWRKHHLAIEEVVKLSTLESRKNESFPNKKIRSSQLLRNRL
jgi:hypothetical protein